MAMGAGLRPKAKGLDKPPDPTVRAPALYPAGLSSRRRLAEEKDRESGASLFTSQSNVPDLKAATHRAPASHVGAL